MQAMMVDEGKLSFDTPGIFISHNVPSRERTKNNPYSSLLPLVIMTSSNF